MSRRTEYTTRDVATMRDMLAERKPWKVIGAAVNKSAEAVRQYAYRHGMAKQDDHRDQVAEALTIMQGAKPGEMFAIDHVAPLSYSQQKSIIYHWARVNGVRVSLRVRRDHIEITVKGAKS